MFGRFLLLFTVVPLIELFLLIKIGGVIGALWTVLLVIGTGALGAYLARQQGWRVWNEVQTELRIGRFPASQMIDGLLLLVAGAVLITPGIITDVLGLVLLFPVTRAPIREWVAMRFRRMVENGNVSVSGFWGRPGGMPPGGPAPGDTRHAGSARRGDFSSNSNLDGSDGPEDPSTR